MSHFSPGRRRFSPVRLGSLSGSDLSDQAFVAARVIQKLQSPVMTEFDLLKKPEYIHVVLNHLPIYGTILGATALAVSLLLRSRTAQVTALILTLIAGVSSYPVFVTGQRAYKTIRSISDDSGSDWLDEHMDR